MKNAQHVQAPCQTAAVADSIGMGLNKPLEYVERLADRGKRLVVLVDGMLQVGDLSKAVTETFLKRGYRGVSGDERRAVVERLFERSQGLFLMIASQLDRGHIVVAQRQPAEDPDGFGPVLDLLEHRQAGFLHLLERLQRGGIVGLLIEDIAQLVDDLGLAYLIAEIMGR